MRKRMMKRKRVQAEAVRRLSVGPRTHLWDLRDLVTQRRFGYLEELFIVEECNRGHGCVTGYEGTLLCEEEMLERWTGSEQEK